MTIVWNKVTWYSKLLAALFFIFVVPALTFYIGKQYGNTQMVVNQYKGAVVTPAGSIVTSIPKNLETPTKTLVATTSILTGVSGIATLGPTCPVEVAGKPCPDSPYIGTLIVYTANGKISTTTKTRPDGKFVLFLSPGTYSISLPSTTEPFPSMAPAKVSVTKGTITHVTLSIDNGIR